MRFNHVNIGFIYIRFLILFIRMCVFVTSDANAMPYQLTNSNKMSLYLLKKEKLNMMIYCVLFIRCWSAACVKMCFHCKVIKSRGCCCADTPCVMTA